MKNDLVEGVEAEGTFKEGSGWREEYAAVAAKGAVRARIGDGFVAFRKVGK